MATDKKVALAVLNNRFTGIVEEMGYPPGVLHRLCEGNVGLRLWPD